MKPIVFSVPLATVLLLLPGMVGLSTHPASYVQSNPLQQVDQLNQQATQQINRGEFSAALRSLDALLQLYRRIGDRAYEGATLGRIGEVYRLLQQPDRARDFYTQALEIAQQLQNRDQEAVLLTAIGVTYKSQGDYESALKYYQQALEIRQTLTDLEGQAINLNNIGEIYRNQGRYALAIDRYQQALQIFRSVVNLAGEAATLHNLGAVYDELGRYEKAREFYDLALGLREAIGDQRGMGATLNNLGLVYQALKQPRNALTVFNQALKLRQASEDRLGTALTLNNIGLLQTQLGQHDQALQVLTQALTLFRELGDRANEGNTLDTIGTVYRNQGQWSQALTTYQQALARLEAVGDRPRVGIVLTHLGSVYAIRQEYRQAEEVLYRAVRTWEMLRPGLTDLDRVSLQETQTTAFRLLQQVLIAQKRIEAALEVAERGRARAFIDLLAGQLDAATLAQVNLAPPNIQQIQQIAREQQATLVEYSIVSGVDALSDAAAETTLLIWVIHPDGRIDFRQSDLQALEQQKLSLENMVVASRSALGVRGITFVENQEQLAAIERAAQASQPIYPELTRLYQLLIQPIADLLPSDPDERIIFLPQRSLFFVPFAALQNQAGQYLIEHHTIQIAPAIQVLALTRKLRQNLEHKGSQDVLVVGNPTMPALQLMEGQPAQQLANLPGAEKEAHAIAQLFRTKALIGPQATETAMTSQIRRARFVHLATHGLLTAMPGLEIPGAIVLAPDQQADGFLTTAEILNLRLNAELVVLSACDTGLGKITDDGIIGLSRAFIAAGVPSVVASLWKVPDEPTAFLMIEFYQNLKKKNHKTWALRQAMLTTLKQYSDPKTWAAFTLIGEP